MAPKSRGIRPLFDAILNPSLSSSKHICHSCRRTLAQQHRAASTATAQASIETPPISQLTPDEPQSSPLSQPQILVKAGVVLSRPPLITPDQHPFESAFYLYQRRLNERLVLPFSQYFHYKRGTPAFEHWRAKRRERGGVAARDLGKYNAYTNESWNDEVLVGDDSADQTKFVQSLVAEEGRENDFVGEDGDATMAGLKRTTEADRKNDQRSLERRLTRTLYLLVKNRGMGNAQDEKHLWTFPAGAVEGKEGLKEGAKRILGLSCGVNMNTWFIAGHPIGHCVEQPANAETSQQPEQQHSTKSDTTSAKDPSSATLDSIKTFFMKARIFAGQANVTGNQNGVVDFKWLSKDEVESHVTPEYWAGVKNMLVEQ